MRKDDRANLSVDQLRKMGYETSDVSLPVLLRWVGYLFIFIGAMSVASYVVYKVFAPDMPEAANMTNPKGPAEPQIQALPVRDMKTFRREEEERLTKYGWVDRNAGVVHIPVDRALDLIAERGLPKQLPPGPELTQILASPNPNAGSVMPNEPGSTRPEFPEAQPQPQGVPQNQPMAQPQPGGEGTAPAPSGPSGQSGGTPSNPSLSGNGQRRGG